MRERVLDRVRERDVDFFLYGCLAAGLPLLRDGVEPRDRDRVLDRDPDRLRYRFRLPLSLSAPSPVDGTVWSGVDSRLSLRDGLAVGDRGRFPSYNTEKENLKILLIIVQFINHH